MGLLRHYLQGALVWTTAASVLLAGFPHYQCRCPDGSLKLFCFGWAAGTDCCCRGACCSAAAGERGGRTSSAATAKPAKKKCCCCHDPSAPDGEAADTHARATTSGCQKMVSPADFVAAPAPSKVPLDSPSVAPLFLAKCHPLPLLSPDAGCRPFTWDSYRAPPPTDLVILLQHFVI